MNILLTNDDGITSRGLFQAKQALERFGDVQVIAPDSNRSGTARGITIHRSLNVAEVELRDGTAGYATDGTRWTAAASASWGWSASGPT